VYTLERIIKLIKPLATNPCTLEIVIKLKLLAFKHCTLELFIKLLAFDPLLAFNPCNYLGFGCLHLSFRSSSGYDEKGPYTSFGSEPHFPFFR